MSTATSPTASTEVLAKLFFYNLYDRLAAVAASAASNSSSVVSANSNGQTNASVDLLESADLLPSSSNRSVAPDGGPNPSHPLRVPSASLEPPTPPRSPINNHQPNPMSAIIENFHQTLNQRIEHMAAVAVAAAHQQTQHQHQPLISVTPASKLMAQPDGAEADEGPSCAAGRSRRKRKRRRKGKLENDSKRHAMLASQDQYDLQQSVDQGQGDVHRRLAPAGDVDRSEEDGDSSEDEDDDESDDSQAYDLSLQCFNNNNNNSHHLGANDDSSNMSSSADGHPGADHHYQQSHQLLAQQLQLTPFGLQNWLGNPVAGADQSANQQQASTSSGTAASASMVRIRAPQLIIVFCILHVLFHYMLFVFYTKSVLLAQYNIYMRNGGGGGGGVKVRVTMRLFNFFI